MMKVIDCIIRKMDSASPQSLMPKNDVSLKDYEKTLDKVFTDKDIRNIALFGACGAGKSSIIETYKKNHNDFKFIHITLAHHKTPVETENDSTDRKESVLEGKILNQLIHQIDPQKIPQTRFKVKREQDPHAARIAVVLLMIATVSSLHLAKFSAWESFVTNISANWLAPMKQFLLLTTSHEAPLFSGIVCFVTLSIILYKVVMFLQYRSIVKKVKVGENEIELFAESEESYFDKYLNDVLYLFEKTDADIIVFEDIGGYIANQIFQRLREINRLVNDRRNIPLRFLYLMPLEIILPENKRKFFDYTLSVKEHDICDWFIDYTKTIGIYKFFAEDTDYLKNVSFHINDMGLLKDICNEFKTYLNNTNKVEPSYKKLLAMMIYKSRFPNDYQYLKNDAGFVYALFYRKDEFIRDEISSIDTKINILDLKIKAANCEHLNSKEELDIVYSDKLEKCRNGNKTPEELDNEIQRLQDEKGKRLEYISNQNKISIKEINKETRSLQNKKKNIQAKLGKTNLREMLTNDNIDDIFRSILSDVTGTTDFNIGKRSHCELLKYLVRGGYIDETYKEYMCFSDNKRVK